MNFILVVPITFLIIVVPAFADVQQVTPETYAQQLETIKYWHNHIQQLESKSGATTKLEIQAEENWEGYMSQQLANEQVVTNNLPIEKPFWEYLPQPFHAFLHVSYMLITLLGGLAIQQPSIFLFWFAPMAFFVGALVMRRTRRPPFRLPKDFGSTPTDSITTETRVENNQTIEETTIERTSFQNWNEGLWNLVKSKFSRDWENFLKWIAEHPEDVRKIFENSRKQKMALTEKLPKSVKENMACQICGKRFEDNDLLEEHISDNHPRWSDLK